MIETRIDLIKLPSNIDSTIYFSFQVGWMRLADQTVLALQGRVVTHNARYAVIHEESHTWRLKIRQIRESDRGCYMCQINASPMRKQLGCIDVYGKLMFKTIFPVNPSGMSHGCLKVLLFCRGRTCEREGQFLT